MNIKLDIPEKFFEGEELCGYYVSPKMKKVWAVQLDLLAEFARVCEKHNLKWWMDAGTLLGAARHKGFIPWDHDVDVMLLRSEYERFCSIADEEFSYPYRLSNFHNSAMFSTISLLQNEDTTMIPFGVIPAVKYGSFKSDAKPKHSLGISLDVFVVDTIPNNEHEILSIVKKAKMYANIAKRIWYWKEYYGPHSTLWKRPLKAILHGILKHTSLNSRDYFMKLEDVEKSCVGRETSHVSKLCMILDPKFMSRRIWERSWFDDTVYFPFEMLNLPAPSGWDGILRAYYGNWHEFVIRRTPQGIIDPEATFYDTERPYTYYTQEGHMPE